LVARYRYGRQYADDGNHDHQFHQSKAALLHKKLVEKKLPKIDSRKNRLMPTRPPGLGPQPQGVAD
jgi:hypothetical protein